jgi:hypothetical protein
MKIGLIVRAVREPEKVNKKKTLKGHERYISPMRGGGTPEGGSMKFCTFVESLGRNQMCQFSCLSDD